ncbi:Cytidylyltransferase family enzyme [Methanonatronarchaeum thermophilum]|uniref:Cytidylyltransferase family enzyme n=1 Tax=Methanonatronarchaeum thermophilum TaxID=1927129 RepID=A0A1Y3GB31_9EURY|nr:DUF92 domain-containing protein [Methanonatronarchaeum thermophilum]OUJ18628.1 Cytidylyltransferase family enzyme [Methanonatronarchaeum thermophilum]
MDAIIGVGIATVLAVLSYHKEILDRGGSLAAFLMGSVVSVFGGLEWLVLLISFVIIAWVATKFEYEYKAHKDINEGENGERCVKNVIANGMVPVAIVLLAWIYTTYIQNPVQIQTMAVETMYTPYTGYELVFMGAYIGAIATATSDTIASEIGTLDSETRLITNLKKEVKTGANGGVSLAGELASIIGGLTIGLIAYLAFGIEFALIVGPIAGFLGCNIDSLLGATLEKKGILNNEHVNLVATLSGAIIGALLMLI